MQTTSATWKALLAGGGAWLEAVAEIGGTSYTPASAPVITRAVMQQGLSIGNAVSATCRLDLRTTDSIPRAAEVRVKMRLTDGTTTSEWLPAGTFYVSHRQRDPVTGVLTLECYDALLKGNAVLSEVPWTTGTGAVMTTGTGEWIYFRDVWPRKMSDLLNDILMLLGVELDARTQINTGSAYVLERPEGEATINSLLGKIAAAHGGSFIITPEGKLRLVPVVSAAGATPQTAVPVAGVLNRMALGGGGTVTGIRYRVGEEDRIVGDESGIVIDADVSAALAAAVYSQLNGVTYQAYELSGALYDPAVELGDYIRAGVNDDVLSVLHSETATYGPMFHGDIGAPEPGELSDEYPYIGQSAKALSAAKVYADKVSAGAAQALNLSLTQQEIFDRLTDGGLEQGLALEATMPSLGAAGEKKLYLNLDYARFGKLVADFIQGGTLTLGGLGNADGMLQVLDADGNVIGTWGNTGITLNKGAIAGPSVTLGGQDNVSGTMQVLDASGNQAALLYNGGMTVNNGYIIVANSDNDRKLQLSQASVVLSTYGRSPSSETQEWRTGFSMINTLQNDYSLLTSIYTGGVVYMTLNEGGYFLLQTNASIYPQPHFRFGNQGVDVVGGISTDSISVGDGASGTFTTADGKTVTVTKGIITSIV